MSSDRRDLREKVTDIADKAGDRAAGVRDEVRAKGGQALDSSAKGAREVAAGARRNKATVAVTGVAAAVVAAVLAGWRVIRRRKS